MTKANDKPEMKIEPRLLALLVCPLTKTSLIYDEAANELISKAAKLAFPVHNGILVMIPSEARELEEDELAALK